MSVCAPVQEDIITIEFSSRCAALLRVYNIIKKTRTMGGAWVMAQRDARLCIPLILASRNMAIQPIVIIELVYSFHFCYSNHVQSCI